MKIVNSIISMFSSRTYLERYEKTENLRIWTSGTRPEFTGQPVLQAPAALQTDTVKDYIVELSEKAKEPQPAQETEEAEVELSSEDRLKIQLIEKFIEVLTGKKIKIKVPKNLRNCEEESLKLAPKQPGGQNSQNQVPAQLNSGWGLAYDCHESLYEYEKTSFSAEGVIKTSDGKEISFSLELNMSNEFIREQNISIRAGDAAKVDPLVINYNGLAAELTATKFNFDLDTDGTEEQIPFVNCGSGFLALDTNNDGVINDGRELFGPSTGNGFAELVAYDEDCNQWIDENDSIFHNLRIWSKDAQGHDYLVTLGQKGIGAVYLGHISTQFNIKNSENELLGQMNKSGIFVNENGTTGTIQQIDLAV